MGYPTFDTGISLGANVTLSNGNLTATGGATANVGAASIDGVKIAGKYYMEFTQTSSNANMNANTGFGCRLAGSTYTGIFGGGTPGGNPTNSAFTVYQVGRVYQPSGNNLVVSALSKGGTIGMAVDVTNALVWFTVDGVNWNGQLGGTQNPGTGQGGHSISSPGTPGEGLYPFCVFGASGDAATANFGASAFAYTTPSGFSAWNNTGDVGSTHIDLDSVGSGITVGNSAPTVTIASNGSSRTALIIVAIEKDSGIPTVSSVTATGLTFAIVGTAFAYNDGTRHGTIEFWEATVSSSFTGKTVTVNLSGAPDACYLCGMTITNYTGHDASSPWTNSASSTAPSVSVTTTGATGLIIGAFGSIRTANATGPSFVTGASSLALLFENTANVNDMWGAVGARSFSSALSAYSYASNAITSMIWGGAVIGYNGNSFAPAGILIRRTLSPIGTRIGSRQVHRS